MDPLELKETTHILRDFGIFITEYHQENWGKPMCTSFGEECMCSNLNEN